jgi:hypothetical protein
MNESVRICGLGTRVPEETTLEALIALGECRAVFCAVEDPRSFRWLKSQGLKLKKPKGAAEIVAAAKKKGGPVGLAVWGHPQFTSRLAREVERGLQAAKLPYRVYGAISPVGSAFARSVSFLGGDYGYQGLQCYDLETLLADPAALTTRLPLIAFSEKSAAARWTSLFELLAARYPKGHEARVYPAGSDEEKVVSVGKLSAKGLTGATVLVPPAGGAPKRPHDVAG